MFPILREPLSLPDVQGLENHSLIQFHLLFGCSEWEGPWVPVTPSGPEPEADQTTVVSTLGSLSPQVHDMLVFALRVSFYDLSNSRLHRALPGAGQRSLLTPSPRVRVTWPVLGASGMSASGWSPSPRPRWELGGRVLSRSPTALSL